MHALLFSPLHLTKKRKSENFATAAVIFAKKNTSSALKGYYCKTVVEKKVKKQNLVRRRVLRLLHDTRNRGNIREIYYYKL